jgi:hypothetical protein
VIDLTIDGTYDETVRYIRHREVAMLSVPALSQ